MHTIWGLRHTTDRVYTVDPYGNVCTMLQGRNQPSYTRLPQDTKLSEDQEKFVWKDWPFVKGIPRTEATVKGIYYQDWMYGHIYQINDEGTLEYKKELSPVNSHRFPLSTCNVIPLTKEAIEPRELTSRPMLLVEAVDDLEKNEWAYKVSASGNRLYSKGGYTVSYTAIKVTNCPKHVLAKDGWEIVTSAPASVVTKLLALASKPEKPKPETPEKEPKAKEVKIVEKLNLEGEAQPDKLLEAISNLAVLSGKLIDSGEIDAGTKLAEKLTYAIGHVSWKLRD